MNKSSKWNSVFIPAEEKAFETVSNYLFELGATGIEEFREGVQAYFPETVSEHSLKVAVKMYLKELRALDFRIGRPVYNEIPNQDWGEKWREGFKPVCVTDRIVVKPPWESWPLKTGVVVIDIYPRMAFGTGTHETTQLCLVLTEKILNSGDTILDLGTGSGILAIAAAKLGAKSVLALDNDADAVENANENVLMNRVADRVSVHRGSIELLETHNQESEIRNRDSKSEEQSASNSESRVLIPGPFNPARGLGLDSPKLASSINDLPRFNLILANIDRPTLKTVIPQLRKWIQPNGTLVLSGILDAEKEEIAAVLQQNGWRISEILPKGEWMGLACMLGTAI